LHHQLQPRVRCDMDNEPAYSNPSTGCVSVSPFRPRSSNTYPELTTDPNKTDNVVIGQHPQSSKDIARAVRSQSVSKTPITANADVELAVQVHVEQTLSVEYESLDHDQDHRKSSYVWDWMVRYVSSLFLCPDIIHCEGLTRSKVVLRPIWVEGISSWQPLTKTTSLIARPMLVHCEKPSYSSAEDHCTEAMLHCRYHVVTHQDEFNTWYGRNPPSGIIAPFSPRLHLFLVISFTPAHLKCIHTSEISRWIPWHLIRCWSQQWLERCEPIAMP
jgi:hypothetical protein